MKPLLQVYILASIAVIVGGISGYYIGYDHGWERSKIRVPVNFEECAAAGYPIMESYPRQCRTKHGQIFREQIAVPPTPSPSPSPLPPTDDRMSACVPAGCSGVICADARDAANLVSTCEYRAEYACYTGATCERQRDGECGWTQTTNLTACLKNPPALE